MNVQRIASTLLSVFAVMAPVSADPAMTDYLNWQTSKTVDTPALHYTDHHRTKFVVTNKNTKLVFNLAPPLVGMSSLQASDQVSSGIQAGSWNLSVTDANGTRYDSNLAREQARINLFRHGPLYIEAHVFDLTPTDENGATLPLKGELILHIWGDRLYVEGKIHPEQPIQLHSASLNLNFRKNAQPQLKRGEGPSLTQLTSPATILAPEANEWLALVGTTHSYCLSVPAPKGTERLELQEKEQGLEIRQHFDLSYGESLEPGNPITISHRIHTIVTNALTATAQAIATEAQPFTESQIQLATGGVFSGYNGRAGYYTIGTARPESLRWLYEHPETISTATLSIRNDPFPRTIAIRHENTVKGGRLGAGILTDVEGHPLPITVQNSKNFSGEHEERFYDPGDPEYNESYFRLALRPNESLTIKSHHTFQGWGNHPIKQIDSLQAWMHYYQMSLGVTETTCHVPFRFGGHPGIWIADLRGISGRMWPGRGQPQFDNVGGHRIFHYRDQNGEHYPRYLRSDFRSTGPNLAEFSMDYVTEGGEARIHFEIFEPPQTDVTRCFTTMRVDFDHALSIDNVRQNLRLLSLDTSQQRLRYASFGYLNSVNEWQTLDPNTIPLPYHDSLSSESPLVAFSGNRNDTHQEGNNAILIRHFNARIGNQPFSNLAVGLDKRRGPERMTWMTLDRETVRFQRGDYLELKFIVIPFGRKGDGPAEAEKERHRYGLNSPTVTASKGRVIEDFPARVTVDTQGKARFQMEGGYNILPIRVEGFRDYIPPRLEKREFDGSWTVVGMGKGNLGHQSYTTRDGRYGFIYLVETGGNPTEFRIP